MEIKQLSTSIMDQILEIFVKIYLMQYPLTITTLLEQKQIKHYQIKELDVGKLGRKHEYQINLKKTIESKC
jgi:hypothetical protein